MDHMLFKQAENPACDLALILSTRKIWTLNLLHKYARPM